MLQPLCRHGRELDWTRCCDLRNTNGFSQQHESTHCSAWTLTCADMLSLLSGMLGQVFDTRKTYGFSKHARVDAVQDHRGGFLWEGTHLVVQVRFF